MPSVRAKKRPRTIVRLSGACELIRSRRGVEVRIYAGYRDAVAQGVVRSVARAVFRRHSKCRITLDGDLGDDDGDIMISCASVSCPVECVLWAYPRTPGGAPRRVGKREKLQAGWKYVCRCPELY